MVNKSKSAKTEEVQETESFPNVAYSTAMNSKGRWCVIRVPFSAMNMTSGTPEIVRVCDDFPESREQLKITIQSELLDRMY